ncbi:PREDICTED: DTW domain-containing protein 2 [Haliaeetus leucocephalus]|uniref:DTW domain-containing protein 2 n=1 Tax=Haliaeetus leucocephalus TaxID=52644 RepID=UPI00053CB76A|nr:PREDICTED: DTW domain-containing protein 2 [Haliaeetus leucocephalus]
MGETPWTRPAEDTLSGSQPAPALWSEPGAPGPVQPGQAGAWGHLTAAPSAYEGLSGSQDLSEGHSEAQVRLRPAIRKPLPGGEVAQAAPGLPPCAAWSEPMADPAGSSALCQAPPELPPHPDYPVAPWSFEPSPCLLLMTFAEIGVAEEQVREWGAAGTVQPGSGGGRLGAACRPQKVCLCPFLPIHPLKVSTCLYIIQHPAEESRVLRTVPLLAACLPPDKYKILVGRRFSEDRYPELATVCRNPNALILYPGAEATNLEEVAVMYSSPSVMIIIDGTWSQAKDIFYKNSLFRLPKQVQLKPNISSQYVIRTQPTNTCLSTLECAAVALSIMEKNKSIQETILRPLQALCSFQLQHGAQIHHSKEHLLKNGLYDKPMPKNKRKLRRMELLVNNVKI